LSIPSRSESVIREQEFIEATSRITSFKVESRPGVPLTPIEIRLTKDRLSLISRVLSSNGDSYKYKEVILELVDKLGFRGDVVARVKTLAMIADTALQAEDFTQAFATSEVYDQHGITAMPHARYIRSTAGGRQRSLLGILFPTRAPDRIPRRT
jgi:hypothetical protein